MRKRNFIFLIAVFFVMPTFAAFRPTANNRFINKSLYKNVYPSTLNDTREIPILNAQEKTNSNSGNSSMMGKRNVVKRTTNARAATNTGASSNNARRVIPRSTAARGAIAPVKNVGKTNNTASVRGTTKNVNVRYTTSSNSTSSTKVSAQRCFADYKECMEYYCQREDAAYNRCYCSAKLAQIDAKYQNKIDELIQKIIKLKYNVNTTDEEIAEYWDKTVGTYTQTNPWVNIDNALNIDWADTESRVRGQNAFVTGHSYCAAHLRGCSYMASNLRDAYKSEIARDCETYEKSLQQIQNAAESVIESYND